MKRFLRAVFAFLFAACSADLPHEAPFDARSPLERQAKGGLAGRILLEGETDHSQITVELQSPNRTYTVDTQNDGLVYLRGIVPGSYSLSIRTRYFIPISDQVVITLGDTLDLGTKNIALRKSNVLGSAVAEQASGSKTGGIGIRLVKSASIRGVTHR